MRPWLTLAAAIVLFPLGCGGGGTPQAGPFSGQFNTESSTAGVSANEPMAAKAPPPAGNPAQDKAADHKGADQAKEADGAGRGEPAKRKIVYNGNVQLIVTDLDKSEAMLKAILKDTDALIASSEITGSAGSPRSGRWRVRVPVNHFDDFMDAVVKVGVPQKNTTDSQDVSDEYYDLEDRIKTKKMELETLRGYLQEKKVTSQLETILTIEKELSRVRGELDQMEGKLRRMKDITALATVTVTMQEIKDYQPAPPPTFGNNVQNTFAGSIDLLARFGKGAAIVVVALAPWLAVLAVIAVPGWRIGRRYWKKAAEIQTVTPAEEQEGEGA
jgi:hypothetical protein